MNNNENIGRRKVAIYIDHSIRLPNFIAAYELFKSSLFSDKEFGVEVQDEIKDNDPRFFWNEQMKDPLVEAFYFGSKPPNSNNDTKKGFVDFFYNDAHYRKFMDDYSFNLYVEASSLNPQDIDVINIAQELLFEIVLIDEYMNKRKKSNTMFFLSKLRVYPQSIIFLGPGQKINENNYFGIWNPATNTDQVNKPGDKTFMEWFKSLEAKQKELETNA